MKALLKTQNNNNNNAGGFLFFFTILGPCLLVMIMGHIKLILKGKYINYI